jgi:D-beta-D-heptose 7-phosphate kinase/D-beta-D-heptose 1-phosphate adenosyltransferase
VEAQVVRAIEDRAAEVDAILVTDQISAVVTDAVLETIHVCREKYGFLLIGDSREGIGRFTGFDVLTPNASEARRDTGLAQVDDAGRELAELSGATFVTRGPQGISVYSKDEDPIQEAARAPKVVDVTGAGDTVSAAVALALYAEASNREAAVIANTAAGIAVGRAGAVTVTAEEVEEALISDGTPLKVKSLPELKSIVACFQSEGKRVVWTNGCFDILHVGHISYLVRAAREGDVLIVGLNSDASVSRVKGPDRPIVPEAERALILSSLEFVDFVTVFSDESPAAILEHLQPDVYSKGGDYTIDTINQTERKIVEGYGGRIAIVPGAEGKSTTNLVERIIKDNDL